MRPNIQDSFLRSLGWRPCAPALGFEHVGPCYSAPWDTAALYALPEREAVRVARFALETGAQHTPTCAKLEAHELERARLGHARMLRAQRKAS
jgi:hypothetical protein